MLASCAGSLSACGSGEDRPGSLVSAGGESGRGGGQAGNGGDSGDAGQAHAEAGTHSGEEAGAAGEADLGLSPRAIFPSQLQVDVGCGASMAAADLVIRNGGQLPLVVSSATATAGYRVEGRLPLQIAAMASATLQVSAPPPKTSAPVGEKTSGSLSFETNEAHSPTHEVKLNTTLFGGLFEFTDSSGTPLQAGLPLTYSSSDACPDDRKYRVHNTGNLAFTLFGPTFPSHFAGTSTGVDGQNVAPDAYVELEVGGNSSADGACSGSGELTFTVQGSFCGLVPKLSVTWPTNQQLAPCACTVGD